MVLCVHQNDVYRHRIAFGLLLQHFGLGIVGFYHGLIGGSQMLAGTFKISLLAAINGLHTFRLGIACNANQGKGCLV